MSFVNAAFAIWVAFLGLCVGSFLNVVIGRLPAGESVVRPGSRCPKCKTPIAWYDNIPVVSWLLLRGKCRKCKTPISPRYILVELLVGVLFLLCYQKFGWTTALPPALIFVSLLVPLTFIDAEHWILPFEITLPGITSGVLLALLYGQHAFYEALFGALIGFMTLRAVEFFGWLGFRKEAMGAGDKFLYAMIGAYLGWHALLGVLLLASIQGAVFGIAKLKLTKARVEEPAGEEEPDPVYTMTWEFLKPGLSFGRRLLSIPYAIFLQPIPDPPIDEHGEEAEWVPQPGNIPFGPWLSLAALEILLWGDLLVEHLPLAGLEYFFGTPSSPR